MSVQDHPLELIEVIVEVSGDPDGLQRIADALEADLADLAGNGPTADELAIAQEQTVRNYELIGNQFWLDVMTLYVLNPDLDPQDVADRIPDTMALTRSDVRDLAAALLTPRRLHPRRPGACGITGTLRDPGEPPAGHTSPSGGGKRLREQLDVGFLHDGHERQVLGVDDSIEGDVLMVDLMLDAVLVRMHRGRRRGRGSVAPGRGPPGVRPGGSAGTIRRGWERLR